MNRKLKSLMLQLLQSPKRFPFEFALGIVFFIIAVWDLQLSTSNMSATRVESTVNGDILWLFAPLMVLTFWLHRVNHLAYIASSFLFLPLMALDLKPFLWTYGFGFTYVLAGILLIVGNKRMNNRPFAAHALLRLTHYPHSQFSGDSYCGLVLLHLRH